MRDFILILIVGTFTIITFTVAAAEDEEATRRIPQIGDGCEPRVDRVWRAIGDDAHRFLYCEPVARLWLAEGCRLDERGYRKRFDERAQRCVVAVDSAIDNLSTSSAAFGLKSFAARREPRLGGAWKTANGRQAMRLEPWTAAVDEEDETQMSSPPSPRCPVGRVPMRQPNAATPVVCAANNSLDRDSACGASGEFRCAFVAARDRFGVCCQRLVAAASKCPPQMTPLLERDRTVRACSPFRLGACRAIGAVCVFDEATGDHHCCVDEPSPSWELEATTAITTLLIGDGGDRDNVRQHQQRPSRLPSGRSRLPIIPTDSIDGCPRGEFAFRDVNKQLLRCDDEIVNGQYANYSICPIGFHCYRSRRGDRAVCCGANSGFCPQNSASLTVSGGRRVNCGTFGSGCPRGFFCSRAHTCCSYEPIVLSCPHGLAAYRQLDGRARRCAEGACPRGYSCFRRYNDAICCPTADNICTQPRSEGRFCTTAESRRRYFYDATIGECKSIVHSGCDGNNNVFDSELQCETYCQYANAPLRRKNGAFFSCSESHACPNGYACHSTLRGNFCCRQADATLDVCPLHSQPQLLDDRPVQCGGDRDCPSGFQCDREAAARTSLVAAAATIVNADVDIETSTFGFCCSRPPPPPNGGRVEVRRSSSIESQMCVDGQPPIRRPDNELQICAPDRLYECPVDHSCQLHPHSGRYQCCPQPRVDATIAVGTAAASACADGFSPQLRPRSNSPVHCEPDQRWRCARFAHCEYSQVYARHICCEPNDLKTLLKMSEEVWTSPLLWRGLHPGQSGCLSDTQCSVNTPDARCVNWTCLCPSNFVAHRLACVKSCPNDYKEEGGICVRHDDAPPPPTSPTTSAEVDGSGDEPT